MTKKYPTTKAGLLRELKKTEEARLSERRRADNYEERLRDARGDLSSALKQKKNVEKTLANLRIAYAELRGYAVSMIDAETPPIEIAETVNKNLEVYRPASTLLPANFPHNPHEMYELTCDGSRLPF